MVGQVSDYPVAVGPGPAPVKKTESASFTKVLSNFGFLMLWSGQLFSQLADRIFVYVLMVIAYSLTKSNLGVSVPLLSFGIPSLLFASLAGVYVDKWDRRAVLTIASIIRGALILLILPLIDQSLGLIFLASLLIYTATQFFAPAETASIPELVHKKDLIVANSLFMITWMASSVVGFGLGAPLVNFLGNRGTFIAAAVMYFISSIAVAMIPLKPIEQPIKYVKGSIKRDLMFGLEFVRRNTIVRYALLKLFVATSAIAILSLLAISYAENILHIGQKNFGYLILAVGLGMFIGMWGLDRLSRYVAKGMIVIFSFIISGMLLVFMSKVKDLHIALLLILLLGICNIFITSSIQTILQQKIPRQIRGRVFGVQNMLINSAFVFPVILSGFVADLFGVGFTLETLGWMVVATGLAGIFLPKFRTA